MSMSKDSKTVVIYRSISGFTKTYANWLAQELSCDLFEGSKVSWKDLMKYNNIIYGSGLYAGGIRGCKLITKHFQQLQGKKLIIFGVGASPARKEITDELKKGNIPLELQDKIHLFYLRGGFDFNKLDPFNKILMTLFKYKLKRVKNPDADTKGMLASYSHPQNFTKQKNLEPIIEFIKKEG